MPPAGFVHTLVDRNFCGAHSVDANPGTFAAATPKITLDWPSMGNMESRSFTFAVIDPHPAPPPPAYPGYVTGARALNVEAYRRTGEALVWHRESHRKSESAQGHYATSLTI